MKIRVACPESVPIYIKYPEVQERWYLEPEEENSATGQNTSNK